LKPVRFHSAAEAEIIAAATYYDEQVEGLGREFISEIARAMESIQTAPVSWPRYNRTSYRLYVAHRFPYVIYFLDLPDALWVAAVAHGNQRPGYWRSRHFESDPSEEDES